MKPKACKNCGNEFQPRQSFQKSCCMACAVALTRKLNEDVSLRLVKLEEKVARKQRKDRLRELDPISKYAQRVQVVFNKYIRLRDSGRGCISCGTKFQESIRYTTGGQWHAGHWKTVKAHPELRFNEYNVNLQCNKCNWADGGNRDAYREGLLAKYGLERVRELEGHHPTLKLERSNLEALERHYSALAKQLRQRIQCADGSAYSIVAENIDQNLYGAHV